MNSTMKKIKFDERNRKNAERMRQTRIDNKMKLEAYDIIEEI